VKSVEGILADADRTLASEHVAMIGLGSIGAGTLRLLLETQPHPNAITLYDPFRDRAGLETLREEIENGGFRGPIRVLRDIFPIPPEAYEASLFVGSTTLPGILDVARLPRGGLLVDYSFPPMFSVGDAISRLETSRDILFTTGGQLRLDTEITETVYLPEGVAEGNGALEETVGALISRDPRELTGCVLASLITGINDQVRTTHGAVRAEDVLAHYRALDALDVGPAQLQMDGYFVAPRSIARFKRTLQKTPVEEPDESGTRRAPATEEIPPALPQDAALPEHPV